MSVTRAWCLALVLAGCEGVLQGPSGPLGPGVGGGDVGGGTGATGGGAGGGSPREPFACTPGGDPSPEVVRRLTPTQYRNALSGVLGRAFSAAQVEGVLNSASVAPHLAALPVDGHGHRADLVYDSMDQRVSPLLVTPQFEVATAVATWVTADTGRLNAFVRTFGGETTCATPDAEACVTAFIDALGLRALRRPTDADDRAHYREVYDGAEWGGYRGLITALLMAPDFIFRTEFRGEALDARADLTALTAWEVASRMAFAITNAPPDDALLDAAAHDFSGEGYELDAHIDRLLATDAARAQYQSFFRQWLRLDRVHGINPSAAAALALAYPDQSAPALPIGTNLEQLRLDAFDELVELMTWYAERGSLRDAVRSDVSFARSAALAQVYGVQPWSGDDDALVHFPAGQRAGLFTRAGYLLSGYPDTNPVMRGARLRVEYLCDVLVAPADTTPPAAYVRPDPATIRADVVAKTEIPGSPCQGCHQHLINPLGFAFETYDAFGRFRTQEPIYDGQGLVTQWVPVDDTTTPNLHLDGDRAQVNGAVELSHAIADSQRFHACYARHTFRYLQGRREALSANEDACLLTDLTRAAGGDRLGDVLRSLIHSPDFTRRRTPAEN